MLLSLGEVTYKCVYFNDGTDSELNTFRICYVPYETLSLKHGVWVQEIEEQYFGKQATVKLERLSCDSVFQFKLPSHIAQYYERMMQDLDLQSDTFET